MAAERGRYVILMGLEMTHDASYVRYRAGMAPILEPHGGHLEPAVAHAIVLAELGKET